MKNATAKINRVEAIKKLQKEVKEVREENNSLKYLLKQTAIIAGHFKVRNTTERTLKMMFPEIKEETEPYRKLIIEMIEAIEDEATAIRRELRRNKTL